MAKFKDFGSTNLKDREAISFKIFDEEFHCVKAIPGKIMLELVSKADSESASDQAEVITNFFSDVLVDESLERFNALIVDKERVVTTETLGEITAWLIEQYGDRPNQQPEV
jgi:hypothetical protein